MRSALTVYTRRCSSVNLSSGAPRAAPRRHIHRPDLESTFSAGSAGLVAGSGWIFRSHSRSSVPLPPFGLNDGRLESPARGHRRQPDAGGTPRPADNAAAARSIVSRRYWWQLSSSAKQRVIDVQNDPIVVPQQQLDAHWADRAHWVTPVTGGVHCPGVHPDAAASPAVQQ